MHKKPRSTQRSRHSSADGHVKRSPNGHDPHRSTPAQLRDFPSPGAPQWGPRGERHAQFRQSNITIDRRRVNASPLAKRGVKFITNYTGQVRIPRDVIGRKGKVVPGGVACLDVGQVPED
jgi:hypothetical protein